MHRINGRWPKRVGGKMTDVSPQTAPATAQPDVADTIKQVAADLNISIPTLYREAALKRIRISKIGARSIIFRSDRASYVKLLKDEADAAAAAGNPPKPKTAA
jgi:hypothetical protein